MSDHKVRQIAAVACTVIVSVFLAVTMGGTAMAAGRSSAAPAVKGAETASAPYVTNMQVHSYNGTPDIVGSGAPTSGDYDYSDISWRILNHGSPAQELSIFGTNGSSGWTLSFGPPSGKVLEPGTYDNAQRIPTSNSNPTLDAAFGTIANSGFDCSVENMGYFVISNISWSGNNLTSFSAYADMNCENSSGSTGYDIVRILYNSNAYLHIPDYYGYAAVTSTGSIANIGEGILWGIAPSALNKPIVGVAHTPDQLGYWMVASDGGILSFGDAHFYGSTGHIRLNKPIVGMAATPGGKGYWLVASDGGIFAYGDAQFYGSTGHIHLNQPVVGMAATPDGKGYWLVASDGGIFAYGDAQFYGSTGHLRLAKPIVGMASTPDGGGYWLLGSDGGIFNFGDAPFDNGGPNTLFASPQTFVGMSASTY